MGRALCHPMTIPVDVADALRWLLLLGTAIAVAMGGIALGMGGIALGNIPVEAGDVLHLALEDDERRPRKRLAQLLPCGKKPERSHDDPSCRRLDGGGIEPAPDHRGRAQRGAPRSGGNEGIRDDDVRSPEGFQGLAAEDGVAIVVVHHARKAEADDPFECLSGSTGPTGTSDTTLVPARDSRWTTPWARTRRRGDRERADVRRDDGALDDARRRSRRSAQRRAHRDPRRPAGVVRLRARRASGLVRR